MGFKFARQNETTWSQNSLGILQNNSRQCKKGLKKNCQFLHSNFWNKKMILQGKADIFLFMQIWYIYILTKITKILHSVISCKRNKILNIPPTPLKIIKKDIIFSMQYKNKKNAGISHYQAITEFTSVSVIFMYCICIEQRIQHLGLIKII